MRTRFRIIGVVACLLVVVAVGIWLAQRARLLEARRLQGEQLLENLRGYVRVERLEEAAKVLESLRTEETDTDYLDQAR
jgi:hypothetical protein